MRAGKYRFVCRFESETTLPAFKGSTLRGSLGHALKRICCALRQQQCGSCLLSETCAYAFLFEVKPNRRPENEFRPATAAHRPHPYVLVPPDDNKRVYNAGDPFSFEIILFGPADQYLPHIVFAVQEMGKAGLGKASRQGDGRFRLDTVHHADEIIYDGVSLKTDIPPTVFSIKTSPPLGAVEKIVLKCETPLRLKYDNNLSEELPFHLIIRAALRRVATLENAYGDGEPTLDYKGLAKRACDVCIASSSCHWVDIERYSNRQKTAMMMGGVQGSITFAGENLNEFLPLLRYCEFTHIGKQTSFGLGRISIETGTLA